MQNNSTCELTDEIIANRFKLVNIYIQLGEATKSLVCKTKANDDIKEAFDICKRLYITLIDKYDEIVKDTESINEKTYLKQEKEEIRLRFKTLF